MKQYYRLSGAGTISLSGSPVLGAGIAVDGLTTDYTGTTRGQLLMLGQYRFQVFRQVQHPSTAHKAGDWWGWERDYTLIDKFNLIWGKE